MAAAQFWFCALLLGPAVGSFCGAMLYRVPRRQSLFSPPSHCTACGHRLGPLDLVPILSYLYLHGRCRYCHQAYPTASVLVEAGVAFFAALGALAGWPGLLVALTASLGVCCVTARHLREQHAASEEGSSLLEVALAAGLLGIALTSVVGLFSQATLAGDAAYHRAVATSLAVSVVEHYRALGYSHLNSTNGDCSGALPSGYTWPASGYTCTVTIRKDTNDTAGQTLIKVTVKTSTQKRSAVYSLYTYATEGG